MWFQQSNGGGVIGWWLGADECSKDLDYILVVNERRDFNSISINLVLTGSPVHWKLRNISQSNFKRPK